MKIKKILIPILLILSVTFIFCSSYQDGNASNERSYKVLEELKKSIKSVKNFVVKIGEGKEEKLSNGTTENSNSLNNDGKNENSNGSINSSSDKEGKIDSSKDKSKENKETSSISEKMNFLFRKCAHGIEFFTMTFVLTLCFYIFTGKVKKYTFTIFFISLFLAVMDEFFQKFIPGRTSSVRDVLVDFSGAVLGFLLCLIITSFKRKKNRYSKKSKELNLFIK